MAQTIPDIPVDRTWISLNSESGIAIGTAVNIQLKNWKRNVIISEGVQPSADSIDGRLLTPQERNIPYRDGSLELWVRTKNGSALIHVEEQ